MHRRNVRGATGLRRRHQERGRDERGLRRELRSLEETGECDLRELADLFAPMNSLHDTAIDNGWEEAFAEIVTVVDDFTAG